MTFRLLTYNILDGGEGREAALIDIIRAVARITSVKAASRPAPPSRML